GPVAEEFEGLGREILQCGVVALAEGDEGAVRGGGFAGGRARGRDRVARVIAANGGSYSSCGGDGVAVVLQPAVGRGGTVGAAVSGDQRLGRVRLHGLRQRRVA